MQYEIPQGIDDPHQVLLWNASELAPVVLGLVIGMVIGSALLPTLGGLIATHVYRRFSERRADGYVIHSLYYAGAPLKKTATLPNPYVSVYVP